MNIVLVVGTRPNFMKAVPVWKKLKENHKNITPLIAHTGQHYSPELSDIFLKQFNISVTNDIHLIGNYPKNALEHQSMAWMIQNLGNYFLKVNAKKVVVFGDVNSTLAGAMAAKFLSIPVIHVEAGLRSFDMGMPEERNRVLVDKISEHLCCTEPSAMHNLKNENITGKIHYTGNSMIDTLQSFLPIIKQMNTFKSLQLLKHNYIVTTIHRQENVDNPDILRNIFKALGSVNNVCCKKIIFPMHPRTKNATAKFKIPHENMQVLLPQGYLEMMNLLLHCGIIITDSGGLQEESSFLGVPCITLRTSFERPATLKDGSNVLLSPTNKKLADELVIEVQKRFGTHIYTPNYKKISGNGTSAKSIASIIAA